MHRIFAIPPILAGLCAAAAAQKIDVEFDHAQIFTQYKTYSWRQAKIKSKNPALDNSIVDRNLHSAIDGQMAAKGFRLVEEKPDVQVTYSLAAQRQKSVDYVPGPRSNGGARRRTRNYTQGTLIIDLVDVETTRLVWRAIVEDAKKNATEFEKHLDKDVKKAFDKYPPKR